jgi:BON domain
LRILTVLALFLLSLSAPGRSFASTATTRASALPPNTVSDLQITQTIQAKLAKSKIGQDGFRFHVVRGVVTWQGTTNVIQHKGSATRMAKSAGAIKVINNIQVSAAAKAKAAQQLKKAAVQEN